MRVMRNIQRENGGDNLMSGGMETCGHLFETRQTVNSDDREKVIDAMHQSFLEYSGRTGNKKRLHPSREVYGSILDHARLWKIAVDVLNKEG